MGQRAQPLRFVCRACGAHRETVNTGNRGIYCDKKCRAAFERKGREQPSRYRQDGYWMLRWNDGGHYRYQFEHRRVWEERFGPVPAGHDIHHVNGDRADNRVENLRCLSRRDHAAEHAIHKTAAERRAVDAARARQRRAARKMAG